MNIPPDRVSEWREKAQQAYEETRRLAPDHPMVLLLGAGLGLGRDDYWLERERVLQQVQPDWDPAFFLGTEWDMYYGTFLIYSGRAREAVAPLQRLRQKHPLVPAIAFALASAYDYSGNIQAYREELERAATLPNAPQSIIANFALYDALGDNNLQAIHSLAEDVGGAINREMGPLAGDKPALRAALRRAWSDPANRTVIDSTWIALWFAFAGEPELALEALNTIVDAYPYNSAKIWTYSEAGMTHRQQWFSPMRDVRKLPGFKDLVRKLGLVGYWRKSGAWADFCRPLGETDFECE